MSPARQPRPSAPPGTEGSRRDFLKYAGVAAATSALAGCGLAGRPDDGADIIFRGGPILTMDAANPRAEALAVADGRIIAVGGRAEVEAQRRAGTRMIELEGRTMTPGLIDPHIHSSFVLFDDWLDVSPLTTASFGAVLARLRDAAAQAEPGEWVRAQAFDPQITRGGRAPTLAELDAAAPDNPLFLAEKNGHVAWVNSKAMQSVGLTRDTPDPPKARFGRDANGDPTGRLEERNAMAPFGRKLPRPSAGDMRMRVRRLLDVAASKGCTALHDCSIGAQAGIEDYRMLEAVMAIDPPVRYRGMLVGTSMDVWERENLRPGRGDDRFRVDGIKLWLDGPNQTFAAFQREVYPGRDTKGALNYTQAALLDALRRAHQEGWQVGVQANGDAGVDATLSAFGVVVREAPRADCRHRIEHCSVLHPEQMLQMRRLGLSPSFQIGEVRWWGKAIRDNILGAERAKHFVPCASALRRGLRISLHSDWNATPISPLRCVEDAVTRVMHDGEVFFPDERIPVEAALRAVTLDAAWQCRIDDIAGSLEPGKYADLTVLEQDPTAIDPARIGSIAVSETWLQGVQRYGL